MSGETTISSYENGPFLVTGGPFRLADSDGDELSGKSETIALCRCGASAKKPFCDGMHSKIGFKAAQSAV